MKNVATLNKNKLGRQGKFWGIYYPMPRSCPAPSLKNVEVFMTHKQYTELMEGMVDSQRELTLRNFCNYCISHGANVYDLLDEYLGTNTKCDHYWINEVSDSCHYKKCGICGEVRS